MAAKLRRYVSDLFESKAVRYKIELPACFPIAKMGMEQRRHFWLLFKEMVANVAQHSHCAKAKIKLSASGKKGLQLVAVEYAAPTSLLAKPPAGFTGDYGHWDRNDTFGLWTLHAWIWLPNPDGIFADLNPLLPE